MRRHPHRYQRGPQELGIHSCSYNVATFSIDPQSTINKFLYPFVLETVAQCTHGQEATWWHKQCDAVISGNQVMAKSKPADGRQLISGGSTNMAKGLLDAKPGLNWNPDGGAFPQWFEAVPS